MLSLSTIAARRAPRLAACAALCAGMMALSTAATAAAPAPAPAAGDAGTAQNFWYGGVEAGYARLASITAAGDALNQQGLPGFGSQRRDHGNVGFTLGYQFQPGFAAEASYQELGQHRYGFATAAGGGSGDWRSSGVRVSVVSTLPVAGRFSLYGRAGVFLSHTELRGDAPVASQSTSGASLTAGMGLVYALSGSVDATLGWDRYQSLGNANTGKTNVDNFALGLRYRF